jgi:alpha-glucosidase
MKRILTIALIFCGILFQSYAKDQKFALLSPNGKIKLSITVGDKISYSISGDNIELLSNCQLGLKLGNDRLGWNPVVVGTKRDKSKEEIKPYISLKKSSVINSYNSFLIDFKGDFSLEFRAFDEGVSYRFISDKKGTVKVMDEEFSLFFPDEYLLHLQQTGGFKTAYEEPYSHLPVSQWTVDDKISTLPILVDTQKGFKILISESDLSDYPCMFVKSTGSNGVKAIFPKVPLEFEPNGDRSMKITKEADYIAQTKGKRHFPWRYFVVADNDKKLIENTMTLKLAPESEIKDPSWIKPGQVSWEWWNGASPYGPDVNFVSGYNLETYKYYIDFASKFGIPYIIMDEGWAKSTTDPYTPNPKVDVHELIRYGKENNVGIVLWLTWLTVHENMDLFKTFNQWGVKGVKIDFMDRSDQWMVNFYENVAKEAAKHQLFVDFHGSFKPAGLEYKYPNVLSYEGVRGMEQMGGCTPDNSVYFPFMRNAVGPMDYTPGAMISMQPDNYISRRPNSASIGTRAYQLALFVVFESGIQMLADNPTLYYNSPECTEFITQVPTTWDDTKALEAIVGEIAVVAKRKGDKWFIGGMTNGEKEERTVEINFDFLEKSRTYTMAYFEDGINAGRQAMDFRKKTKEVKFGDKIEVKMVRNGGWAAVLE